MPCPFPLRRHQAEALAAVERARESGSRRWWITMPPGAGKTILGTEVARLVGRPTVVFLPNTAIQDQWVRTHELYDGPPAGTDRDLLSDFTSLTYQSLAVFDSEEAADSAVLDRLHPNGRALVAALRARGEITVILDECHHLLEVWGTLLAAVLDDLPDAVVLGLTATPPTSMTRAQARLTDELFGPVLYEARIPALVVEGTLAPYSELAWLVTPTAAEEEWLAGQAERFAELTSDLFDPAFGSTPLPVWLTERFVGAGADDGPGAAGGGERWRELARREPELADAALRFVHAGLLAQPTGATLHEQHRRPLSTEDWITVVEDWLEHRVRPGSATDERDATVLRVLRRTLPAVDQVLGRRGIHAGPGLVDRVTARSAAKQAGVVEICLTEAASAGPEARVLVLCDHEEATATTSRRVADGDQPPPEPAGSGRGVLGALLADPGTHEMAPLLVTGRTVAGADDTLRALVASVSAQDPDLGAALRVDDGEIRGPWSSRQWVAHATAFFSAGGVRVLVGTRGLLGEGWDAPAVSTLVDLTTATTATAVVQTRGRALRTDPSRPDKVALIWTVVCVSEGHPSGSGDWSRFVRKHRGFFTVDEQGAIVDGVAGVDSRFGEYAAPPADSFAALDAQMLVRAERRDEVREAWDRIEAPDDVVRTVVRLRSGREGTAPATAPHTPSSTGVAPFATRTAGHPGGAWAAVPLVAAAVAPLTGVPTWLLVIAAVLGVVLAAGWWGRSRLVALSSDAVTVPQVASALADALAALGSGEGHRDLDLEVGTDGELRVSLRADEATSARFAAALEEAVAPVADPRYVIARDVYSPPGGHVGRWLVAAVAPRADQEVWHAVPGTLADRREHADAYAKAWATWVGGGRLLFTGRPKGAGVLVATRGLDPFAVTAVLRREWT